jgi:hypothetical protein
MRWVVGLLAVVVGCNKSDTGDIPGLGVGSDARLVSDVYTWSCSEAGSNPWLGAMAFDVSLEYVPDALPTRALPPRDSCSYGLSMFAGDSLVSGVAIPGADASPGWRNRAEEGRFSAVLDGLYYSDVFKNVLSCDRVEDVIGGGVELFDAGVLDGVTTPLAGDVTSVEASRDFGGGGIPFGEEISFDWQSTNYDESFIQIRRERDGVAYETVTCNTTGNTSFTLDASVWDLLDPVLTVDKNFLYVGFRNVDEVRVDAGNIVEVETRALHVVGITQL